MYIARKAVSIGPRAFEPGDEIDRDSQKVLPAGRLMKMVEHGFVEHLTDEGSLARRLTSLEDLVAELSAKINALETRRGPGRPRKEEDSNG
jgi:hypothetical protein